MGESYILSVDVCTCAQIHTQFSLLYCAYSLHAHFLSAMSLQALADFESMEKAFSDLHTRYFKLKELTQAMKKVGRLLCYVYRGSC